MGCSSSKEPQFISAPAANGVGNSEPAFYYTDAEPTAYAHESSIARVRGGTVPREEPRWPSVVPQYRPCMSCVLHVPPASSDGSGCTGARHGPLNVVAELDNPAQTRWVAPFPQRPHATLLLHPRTSSSCPAMSSRSSARWCAPRTWAARAPSSTSTASRRAPSASATAAPRSASGA